MSRVPAEISEVAWVRAAAKLVADWPSRVFAAVAVTPTASLSVPVVKSVIRSMVPMFAAESQTGKQTDLHRCRR